MHTPKGLLQSFDFTVNRVLTNMMERNYEIHKLNQPTQT